MVRTQKVVQLRRKGGVWRCPEDVMNTLRLTLYNEPAKEVAESMGVSVECVYAIRAGRTKWPRGDTLFALLAYNRLAIQLVPN